MLWSVLSLEAKMILVIVCAIIIFASLLIVVCFLVPGPWWNCPFSGDELADFDQDSNIALKDFHQRTDDVNATADLLKPRLSRSEFRYDCSVYSMDSGRPGSAIATESSSDNTSSAVSDAGISPCSSRSGSMTTLQSTADEQPSRPQVHVTLQSATVQQSSDSDNIDQQLIITIENATDLPTRSYVETVDPSVTVRLERRSSHLFGTLLGALIGSGGAAKGRRNSNHLLLDEDFTCPVVYHSRHPRYHHPVTLAVPKSTQLKDCQLVLKVEDKDKLVGVTELGQCRIDLRELDLLPGWLEGKQQERESLVRLSRFLEVAKPDEKGAIFLGLSFLPTSQRITVQITQCNRLIKIPAVSVGDIASQQPIKAVVRLFLLNESGRVLKKRKTAPFDYPNGGGGGRIELGEIFHLDVEIERWDRCAILIVLSRIYELPPSQQSSSDPDENVRPSQRSPPVYHHSGHVALGKRVSGHAERIHWNSAFQNPRRVISQWHSLH